MNNLLSYGGLIDARMSKLDKYLPVSSQQKNVLNEEENGTDSDQTPTMIFQVITPDGENGNGGSSENVSQTETFNSHDLFAGRAQFAGRGFHI